MNKRILISLTILSSSIATIGCNSTIIKHQANLSLEQKKESKFQFRNKQKSTLLLKEDTKDSYPIIKSSLIENNNIGNIGKINLNLELNSILNINKIFKKWNKRVKQTLKNKKELEAHKKKKKIIVATTTTLISLLLASGIIGTSVYIFKYNKEPLHKIESYLVDLSLKAFLKFKKIDVDFENSFRNLMFYLFKENEKRDKRIISYFFDKLKDVILKKEDIKNIINKDKIEQWIKEFGDEGQNNNIDKKDNPISYFLKILEGDNGKNILMEFVKLLTKMFDKSNNFNQIIGFGKIISLFKKHENTEGILSSIASTLAGFDTVKNGVDYIIGKIKELVDSSKKGLINILEKFILILRKNINKNKNQYSDLSVLYNFIYNILKLFFGDNEIIITIPRLGGLGNVLTWGFDLILGESRRKFKITDIITPETIKKWIEDNQSDKQ